MRRDNLTIGKRLALGFGVVLLLAVGIGATGYWSANRISEGAISEFHEMLNTDAAVVEHSTRARANVLGLRRFEKDVFLSIDSKESVAKYVEGWKQEQDHLIARLNDVDKATTEEKDKQTVKTMRTELANYATGFDKVLKSIQSGAISTPQEANKAISEYKDTIHQLEKSVKEFSADSSKKMMQTENDIRTVANRAKLIAMSLMMFSVALGVVICIFIVRSTTRPIRKVIEGLLDGAEQVASASGQISSSSQSLAEGASEQAASIEETSSSLEEVASMTRQNAQNTAQVNSLMREASQLVERSNTSIAELSASMQEISRASAETSKIIKTIDEIAFQTNLLALNAAVEAARAGEAGAGFAVVADEVRNLAMRAADAAKNTANLIEGTVKKVKDGEELVARTNHDFSEVVVSASRVGELVGEITAASNEQSQGIEQINQAVAEMDKVVQQNAANAEESAAGAEEMNAQAEQMKVYVEELVGIVGRNGNTKSVSKKGTAKSQASSWRNEAKPAVRVLTRFAKKGNGRGNGKDLVVHTLRGKKINPAQVIPFEEEDMRDF